MRSPILTVSRSLKVDFRMIPILGALYAISGIDRINVSERMRVRWWYLHLLTTP
jgi:hypothetical protein